MESESNFLQGIGVFFLILIFLSGLFEIGLLVYAYLNADKVSCNLLWCTFTSEKSYESIDNSSYSTFTTTSSSTCYEIVKGVKTQINCSEINKQMENYLP